MPSTTFPYRRIVDELRAAILEGRVGPGERLPSEREIAERYDTSRPTVRRATALLKAEGLVVSEQGRGIFVQEGRDAVLAAAGVAGEETEGTMESLRNLADPVVRARQAGAAMVKHQAAVTELARIRRGAIDELRERGLSHGQVAEALGMSRGRVSQLVPCQGTS